MEYPQCPCVNHLLKTEREEVLCEWRHKCKQFTDCHRKKGLKDSERVNTSYSYVINPCLHTMAKVSGTRLHVGDLFPSRDIVTL